MADMTVEEAMAKYGLSELTRGDLLELDDPHYTAKNVALVTGAGSGIGQATALAFAANGLTVVATDRDEAGLEDTGTTEGEATTRCGEESTPRDQCGRSHRIGRDFRVIAL